MLLALLYRHLSLVYVFFFLNYPAPPEIYPLPLHDALPISIYADGQSGEVIIGVLVAVPRSAAENTAPPFLATMTGFVLIAAIIIAILATLAALLFSRDRKSTRLNSSHT